MIGWLPVANEKVESANWMFDIGLDGKRIGEVWVALSDPAWPHPDGRIRSDSWSSGNSSFTFVT